MARAVDGRPVPGETRIVGGGGEGDESAATAGPGAGATVVGRPGSFLLGCGIGLVLLVGVGSVVAVRAKRAEDERRRLTEKRLHDVQALLDPATSGAPPAADGSGSDWTGQQALARSLPVGTRTCIIDTHTHDVRLSTDDWIRIRDALLVSQLDDGWGHPFLYRRPGPVHEKGWDLWSCGPNGKDDHGTFDDLLVGADVADVTSER